MRRIKPLSLVIVVAALLVACNRHEASLTGSYGERVVAGRAVMASEMADASPAGVQVVVVGTGMSASLAADGRFTFVGVPENAELQFSRADGIDARVRVSSSSAPLVVELNGTKGNSHRHSVGQKDPGPSQQIEGTIQSVGTGSIVVLDSHGATDTITVNDKTLIRKGDQTVKLADLKANDRVHVKATTVDNKLTASQIVVQDAEDGDDNGGDHGNPQQQFEGSLVSATPTLITVHSSHGSDVDITINSSTVIRQGDKTLTAADLKKGMHVHVQATMSADKKLTATQVIVQGGADDGDDHD